MRSLSTLCVLAAATSSASAQAAGPQSALAVVGVWRIILPSGAPTACNEMSIEFRGDGTMLTRSGALLATNTYSLLRKADGWLLVMGYPHTNGQPNCQGLPADFVVQNFVAREYVKIAGDTLRECNANSPVPDCLSMVRRDASPSVAIAPHAVAQEGQRSAGSHFDYEAEVGVVGTAHGGDVCIAIRNSHIAAGTAVVMVWVPVVGETEPAELLGAHAIENAGACTSDSTMAFVGHSDSRYRLEVLSGRMSPGGFYFGVLAPIEKFHADQQSVVAQLEANEPPATFRACTSHEGVHLTIWGGEPLKGARLWHRYVHFDYETEPRCQEPEW